MNGPVIQSVSDFAKTPAGLQERWTIEIAAAKKHVRKWQETAKKLVDRFLDLRESKYADDTRVNLFSANCQTQRAMLYGRTPRVDVSRRFNDQNDDVARVAALMLERMLNTSIESDTDTYAEAIAQALDDRLLVGLGVIRLRYEAEFEDQDDVPAKLDKNGKEQAPAYTPAPKKTPGTERVCVDYVHWRDFLWSPARTWREVRWVAFAVQMTREELQKRFGAKKAAQVQMQKGRAEQADGRKHDPWARATVYEIWSKEDRKTYWFADGCLEILDVKDDPLGLKGYFPCPRPMIANATNDSFIPRPDFKLAEDLYDEIDAVSTRITTLERAIKVVGVYDKTAGAVTRLMNEACQNELIAVDNWAMFAERGGLKGQIDWLPIEQVVAALDKLRDYRTELIKLTYEVTGFSDIMRGEQQQGETATTSALKARFASVRMQFGQDEFARFASDALRVKAEIIAGWYDDDTIYTESNIRYTPDEQQAKPAIQMLRDDAARFRIEVKPENLALQDFEALRSERAAFMAGLTQFLQAAAPMLQAQPGAAPYLLEMLKWGLSGFRGASSIEGVLDQAIAEVKRSLQTPQQPQQDPKVEAQREKAQLDVGVAREKAKIQVGTLQQKAQIDQARLGIDAARARMEISRDAAELRNDMVRAATQPQQPQQPQQEAA